MTIYRVWELNYGLSQGTFESADEAPQLHDLTLDIWTVPAWIEERTYPLDQYDFAPERELVEWVLMLAGREVAWIAKDSGPTIREYVAGGCNDGESNTERQLIREAY